MSRVEVELEQAVFFNGWPNLLRVLVVGVLAYVALVLFLRLAGARSLAKMNAFDFVVTVALGSTLATIILSRDTSLAEGAAALALLIALQFAVTWTSVRAQWLRKLITGEPAMLLYRGRFLPEALKAARITRDEVRSAVRDAGWMSVEQIEAVVLETDGTFAVVWQGDRSTSSAIQEVKVPGSKAPADFAPPENQERPPPA